jgi:hypothetical protein
MAMTVKQAKENIGSRVAYSASYHQELEYGVIKGVSDMWQYVYVIFDGEVFSKSTPPELLTLVN